VSLDLWTGCLFRPVDSSCQYPRDGKVEARVEKGTKKNIAENRKARHDYHIEEVFEAGLVLTGTEVKSLRQGRVNLKDSYARIRNGEVYVYQMHISPYTFAYYDNHDPLRPRKLLLHKREIKRLYGKVNEQGSTLVPLQLYFKDGKVKMALALARGKRKYDKRESIRRREGQREMDRVRKQYTSRY
jgi:SsrA-binding protein